MAQKQMDYYQIKAKAKELGMNTNGKTTQQIVDFVKQHSGNGKVDSIKKATKDAVAIPLSEAKKKIDFPKKTKTVKAVPEKGQSISSQIKSLHAEGKTVDEIKTELGLTEGHYVNDIVWRINNPSGKKK